MFQPVPKNHSTPEMVMSEELAARLLSSLANGHTARIAERATLVSLTSGETFVWFKSPRTIGDVHRMEFRLGTINTSVAVHFRLMQKVTRREVMKAYMSTPRRYDLQPTSARGHWYAVHGD